MRFVAAAGRPGADVEKHRCEAPLPNRAGGFQRRDALGRIASPSFRNSRENQRPRERRHRYPRAALALGRVQPRRHRRRDEGELSRLRDERDRGACAARRARRPQARAPAHPVREPGRWLRAGPCLPQVSQDRRRRDGQLSPARRQRDLRRARADDAAVVAAAAADRRPGQLRLDGPRSAGFDALYRGAAGALGDDPARRSRQGHGRFR